MTFYNINYCLNQQNFEFMNNKIIENKSTQKDLDDILEQLKYNEQGLIPAIAYDVNSKKVLMLAWMNQTSIKLSFETGYATYFSRSRKQLWKKGDTSGHTQKLISIIADCDFDSLLVNVEQTGCACHTGKENCFFNEIN